ncbi:MAG: DUF1997 domain-containing protein [Leptolyngbyaceae cyanobacterium SL_7_1]|nr:DUF1997 domain-containing protein [Leptolyngbyaceae cyanobacterium SL_7_1]
MQARFVASQLAELVVTEQPIPIQHYLRQPQRLIQALTDPDRVEQLDAEHFRLKMRPLRFLALSLQPTVDVRVWADSLGTIYIRSTGCEIRGVEYVNQRFQLVLVGQLMPQHQDLTTRLVGRADLEVNVELPPAFWMTPKYLLEATGNGLLRSVLLTIKQRLMHQLLSDYRRWVSDQTAELSDRPTVIPQLSSNSPIA